MRSPSVASFGCPPHTRFFGLGGALAPRTSRGSSGLWRRHLNGCGIAYAGFRSSTGRHHELTAKTAAERPRKTPHDPPAADTMRAGSPRRDPPRGQGRGPPGRPDRPGQQSEGPLCAVEEPRQPHAAPAAQARPHPEDQPRRCTAPTLVKEQARQIFGRPEPAVGIHVEIDCLVVVGNDAWVSGLITHPDFLVGVPAITRVRDNGTSANDPADQVSFTLIDIGVTCNDQPDLPLFDLINGQVKVQ